MKFDDVMSQDHVTTTLKNAIEHNRLASAYLFSGPRGVGKTTTARIFAKAINCEKGPTPVPCNVCPNCKEITESRSLDVFEIDGASNRGIDEVRNLRENLKYSASKGKHKIYIIDEVHMLTTEAFNALLKTLEEPPPKVMFIFATTEFHKVPATILSRCQRYDFRRIPPGEIVAQLQKICSEENIKIDQESLYLLARKADGSMRDSQSLLDQVISFCGEQINNEDLVSLLGIIGQDLYFKCTDVMAQKDVAAGLSLVEDIFNQGYDMGEFLSGLAEHLRNMLVVNATGNANLLEGLESYKERYQQAEVARNFSETDLLRLIQLATDTAFQIKRSVNPKLMLEMALVKMIKMDRSIELDTLISNLNNPGGLQNAPGSGASGSPESASAAAPATKTTAPPNMAGVETGRRSQESSDKAEATDMGRATHAKSGLSGSDKKETAASPITEGERSAVAIKQIKHRVSDKNTQEKQPYVNGHKQATYGNGNSQDNAGQTLQTENRTSAEQRAASLEKIKDEWAKIVDAVKEKKIHLGSFLNEGYPTGLDGDLLEVSFGTDNGFHMRTVEQNKAIIQAVILEQTGFRLRLKCHRNDSDKFNEMLTQLRPASEVDEQQAAEEELMQIPIVKKVIEVFDGEFVQRKKQS